MKVDEVGLLLRHLNGIIQFVFLKEATLELSED